MAEQKDSFVYCATQPLLFSQNSHEAIIQTLDRFLGYDENYFPLLFPAEVYEAALDTVNDAKIVFSSGVHPNYDLYEINPDQAVRDVGGRYAGKLSSARVDRTGHPTTMAVLELDPDPDIEQLIIEGKLSLSPSLGLTRDDAGNIIKIKFQNLLIFPETPNSMSVPRDQGTKILNSQPNHIQQSGKIMAEPTVIETTVEKPIVDPALAAKINEMAAQFTAFQSKTADLEAQIKAKNEELTKKDEAFAQFTEKIEAEKIAAKELEFQGLIHDPLFPEGLLKAENAEEILKSEFNASPAQFTRRVLSVYATQNTFLENAGGEQGQQFSKRKSESKWDTDEGKLLLVKLGVTREQMEG